MMLLFKKIVNRILKRYQISRIETNEKVVYLTFDDGPEPGICEFVLDELRRYNFKATFFCRGDNAEKYPELLQRIKEEGHAIGNHTYSHLLSYEESCTKYCNDIEKANAILNTRLLRPPYGSLTLSCWIKLHRKYKLYFWNRCSDDSNMEDFKMQESYQKLIDQTHAGDIILFHFCQKHQNETMQILPLYCKWLSVNNWTSKKL